MKKTYHLCLSSNDEIIFRDLEDYNRGFNCFALALYMTDSTGLVESFMSTHTHQIAQTRNPDELMYNFRRSYSQYFNHKYLRSGRLGESHHFTMEIIGYHHMIAAISYALRNPLHHGIAPIPFAYPHCTVNSIFKKAFGRFNEEPLLHPRSYAKYIGRRAEYPERYKMTTGGVFLRDSVLDIPQVENLFVTPRSFNYYMSRKSSEEWEKEQGKDGVDILPINLSVIEHRASSQEIERMLIFENGKADYRKITDIELCSQLDMLAKNKYGRNSVYQLSQKEKQTIAEDLYRRLHISEAQIRRCLILF